jgi:hypothetical protein
MNDWAPVKYLAVLATGFLLGAWAVNQQPESPTMQPEKLIYYPGKVKDLRNKKWDDLMEPEELISI